MCGHASVCEARVHESTLTTYRGPGRRPPPPSPALPSPREEYLRDKVSSIVKIWKEDEGTYL